VELIGPAAVEALMSCTFPGCCAKSPWHKFLRRARRMWLGCLCTEIARISPSFARPGGSVSADPYFLQHWDYRTVINVLPAGRLWPYRPELGPGHLHRGIRLLPNHRRCS
jgi:hypothetical protein